MPLTADAILRAFDALSEDYRGDRADAQLLLTSIEGTRQQIWDVVRPFVSNHDLQKASYAFDDPWEALHGPA